MTSFECTLARAVGIGEGEGVGEGVSGGDFYGGTENVYLIWSPRWGDFSADQNKHFLCKIFACGALLDSVFSKFSPAAGFNAPFSLYSLTLKVY